MTALREEIKKVCNEYQIVYGENDELGTQWVEKVLQLYQVNSDLTISGKQDSGTLSTAAILALFCDSTLYTLTHTIT